MDKTMVKRLAMQHGVVDNFEIGRETARQEQLDMDCLTKFANACCAWQKEQDVHFVGNLPVTEFPDEDAAVFVLRAVATALQEQR